MRLICELRLFVQMLGLNPKQQQDTQRLRISTETLTYTLRFLPRRLKHQNIIQLQFNENELCVR